MADHEEPTNKREAAEVVDLMLLEDEVWDECDIGPAAKWPKKLQSLAPFVLGLTHPAAIFWGAKLIVICNRAWSEHARGHAKQGTAPSRSLSDDTIKAIRTYYEGRVARPIAGSELLDNHPQETEKCSVMCSPIHEEENTAGVLVQILCKTHAKSDSRPDQISTEGKKRQKEDSNRNNANADRGSEDETALDRQPFFQKFAEMLPTGLAILDHKANPLFVNHQFHELTAHEGPDQSFKMWPETIHPDDYERVLAEYHKAFESQTNLSTEFRATGESQWRLFLMRPLGDNNLQQFTLRQFGGYICALIDVSSMKNAELAQSRVAKEARERKSQQEKFIDMISHEIRNPLSAVLHCAEDILDAVQNGAAKPDTIPVDEIVESVNTISLCVAHQKNLVDDVLSFSKLDASMLSLAPRATKPSSQMADTLKIFQPELRKQNIGFKYEVAQEYDKCNVDWVMADLVRISQVLVNLMTNAVKFTSRKSESKTISVEVAASIERPESYPPNVVFFKTDKVGLKTDATGNPEWGDGEPLYIMVAVKDTGIGISKENQAKLFERFQQATPKTGQVYGGSGLGLNIARKMCQLHGGEIGVSSVEDEGSTFGFFFRVRRSGQPDDADKLEPHELSRRLESVGHKGPEEVKEDDIPEDLKKASHQAPEGHDPTSPSKDRMEHTAGIANQMQESEFKRIPSDESERSHTTAADDRAQKENNKPENAGRSKEQPDNNNNLELTKSATPEGAKRKGKDPDNKSKEGDKPSSPPPADPNAKPTILFVEDNLINQKLLKKKIESKGFQVTTADNGKQAVDLVQERSRAHKPAFDCILMDQEMPIMDGKTASKAIREFEGEHDLPPVNIIGVTANVREEQQKDMTDSGMNDVIAKPFKMEELLVKMGRGSKG